MPALAGYGGRCTGYAEIVPLPHIKEYAFTWGYLCNFHARTVPFATVHTIAVLIQVIYVHKVHI